MANDINIVVSAQVGDATRGLMQVQKSLSKVPAELTKVQARINDMVGANERMVKSVKSSASAFQDFDRAKNEVDKLRSSLDPAYAATLRYEKAVESLDQALEMGVISQREYNTTISQLKASSATAVRGIDRTANSLNGAKNQFNSTAVATNKFAKGALQQAGYQVGDFAVQISGGQNALQAFGQQGSQLAGIFGPMGAVIGAVIAIVAAVGTAAQKSGSSFMDFSTATSKAKTALEAVSKTTKEHRQELALLASGLKTVEQLKLQQAIASMREAIAAKQVRFEEAAAKKGRNDVSRIIGKQIASMQELLKSMEAELVVNKALTGAIGETTSAAERFKDVVFDPRSPKFDPIIAEFARVQLGIEKATEAANELSSSINRIANIRSQIARDKELILDPRDPRYDEMRAKMAAIASEITNVEDKSKPAKSAIKSIAEETAPVLSDLAAKMQSVGDSIANSFEKAFMSVVDGTGSVKSAFKSMASEIIKELYRVFVIKKITGFISGFIADPAMFGGLGGTSPVNGSVMPTMRPSGVRAMGGQVTGNKAYMVGERGPEMVVPSRNSHVVPNNQMGGGNVTVNQTINVSTGVQQTVRTEIRTLMPQIAEAAKSAVADAKLRGGSYGRSFA